MIRDKVPRSRCFSVTQYCRYFCWERLVRLDRPQLPIISDVHAPLNPKLAKYYAREVGCRLFRIESSLSVLRLGHTPYQFISGAASVAISAVRGGRCPRNFGPHSIRQVNARPHT